jgi:hypothetical protein
MAAAGTAVVAGMAAVVGMAASWDAAGAEVLLGVHSLAGHSFRPAVSHSAVVL